MKLLGILLAGLVASYSNMRLSLYKRNLKRAMDDRKDIQAEPALERPHWQPGWQDMMRRPKDQTVQMDELMRLIEDDLLDQ